jgi:hypothetical protein
MWSAAIACVQRCHLTSRKQLLQPATSLTLRFTSWNLLSALSLVLFFMASVYPGIRFELRRKLD